MLIKFSLHNKSEIRQWDEFVESHPNGTPYHLSCWMRIIQETYSFKLLMYVLKNENGDISGILPFFLIRSLFTGRRIVSLPFSDYGGPLFREYPPEEDLLSEIVKEHKDSVKYIEIRGPIPNASVFVCHNYYQRHVLNLRTDLSELKKLLNKRSIQYSIRKAKKAGVQINEENTQYGMREFYRLNTLTRKKHGVPSQSGKFFEKLLEHVISKGYGSILLAIYDSKAVAASLFLKCGKTIHYKYNASDPEYLKKATPNHLLTWHAIKRGSMDGYQFLDFGRTSPDNKGLIRYKEMWGTEALDLPYYYYPRIKGATSQKESSPLYRMVTSTWRSLPDAIAKKMEAIIFKHLG